MHSNAQSEMKTWQWVSVEYTVSQMPEQRSAELRVRARLNPRGILPQTNFEELIEGLISCAASDSNCKDHLFSQKIYTHITVMVLNYYLKIMSRLFYMFELG